MDLKSTVARTRFSSFCELVKKIQIEYDHFDNTTRGYMGANVKQQLASRY